MKKNKLKKLPVLDPTALEGEARTTFLETWEALNARDLMAVSDLADDPVRALIDDAVCSALDLDTDALVGLRSILGAESKFQPIPEVRPARILVEDDQRQLF